MANGDRITVEFGTESRRSLTRLTRALEAAATRSQVIQVSLFEDEEGGGTNEESSLNVYTLKAVKARLEAHGHTGGSIFVINEMLREAQQDV